MARFFKLIILFLLPLLILLGAYEFILWRSGESMSMKAVLNYQVKHPSSVYLRGFLDQSFYSYKYAGYRRANPMIIALGSSRVFKFRSEMFGPYAPKFFNAGGLIQSLDDLEDFVKLGLKPETKIIILGIDMWWFNDAHITDTRFKIDYLKKYGYQWRDQIQGLRKSSIRKSLWKEFKLFLKLRENVDRLGLGAKLTGCGFRRDGSLESNLPIPENEGNWVFIDREHPPIVERIVNGGDRFEYTDGLSKRRMEQFEKILSQFRKKKVVVIGFLPPLTSSAAVAMNSPRQKKLWDAYRKEIPAVFTRNNMACGDASSPDLLGRDDRYFIDGFHAEETFHVFLLRNMLRDNRLKEQFPKLPNFLENMIKSPQTNYWFPDYKLTLKFRSTKT